MQHCASLPTWCSWLFMVADAGLTLRRCYLYCCLYSSIKPLKPWHSVLFPAGNKNGTVAQRRTRVSPRWEYIRAPRSFHKLSHLHTVSSFSNSAEFMQH